jgi:hypothetical protein
MLHCPSQKGADGVARFVGRVTGKLGRIDRGVWRAVRPSRSARFLLYARTAFPFQHLPIPFDDPQIAASFAYYNAAPQHEYTYHYTTPTLIEPTYGYALRGTTRIIPESMPYAREVGYPSWLRQTWRRVTPTRRVIREPAVISLREFGDGNYYHFYNDVLGRLALLRRWPWTDDWPLLVSRRLFDAPYFQGALARSPELQGRRWIVQDDACVRADQAIFCKALPHSKATFDYVRELLHVPPAPHDATLRIFLTRSRARGRVLANAAEVEAVCRAFDFEILDADGLSLDDQIEVFAHARYVIGIHGAGLINLLFRAPAPLSLLELFPPANIPPHYWWLSQHYGFRYDALVGTVGDEPTFAIDPDRLRARICAMLE